MSYSYFLLIINSLASLSLLSQPSVYELQQIHQTQSFYLNNSTRATIGTGDNRTYLAIDLPPKTKEWYFSFTATETKSTESLNLYSQLINVFEPSGLTSTLFESVAVPEGNIQCNIYLTDEQNAVAFDQYREFNSYPAGSRMNYTEGTARITTHSSGILYLCFENPHSWNGLNILVEAVALVDTSTSKISETTKEAKPSTEEIVVGVAEDLINTFKENKRRKEERNRLIEEGSNYKSTGWVLYEGGDFDNSLTYSIKALDIEKHPSTYFNIGLAYWCKNDTENCTSSYLEGLNLIYELEEKQEAVLILKKGISDLENGRDSFEFYKELPIALRLLEMKLEEVQSLEKWKDRY